EFVAVALDHELLDAVAEGAGDAHFVAVPGAHLDAALEVLDLDPAARIQRTGLVDGRAGVQRRAGEPGAEREGEDMEAVAHGTSPWNAVRRGAGGQVMSARWVSCRRRA